MSLVDVLGTAAGAIWLAGAIYFQMVRARQVDAAYIAAMGLIGLSLMMSSSAIALSNVRLVNALAVVAHLVFIAVGIGCWYVLETRADLQDR